MKVNQKEGGGVLHLMDWGVCWLTDLCDVCGCGGAGSFWSDGLSTQEDARVKVTISVNLYKNTIPQNNTTHWKRMRNFVFPAAPNA